VAELILTEEEKATELWSELDDASIGRIVKKQMQTIENSADQLRRSYDFAAALLLCCSTADQNGTELTLTLDGVTEGDREVGDWEVIVRKK